MITDWIMAGLFGILNGLFGLLPAWSIQIPAGAGHAVGALSDTIEEWVPLTWIASLAGVMLAWGVFRAAWFLIWWIYEKVPFKSA